MFPSLLLCNTSFTETWYLQIYTYRPLIIKCYWGISQKINLQKPKTFQRYSGWKSLMKFQGDASVQEGSAPAVPVAPDGLRSRRAAERAAELGCTREMRQFFKKLFFSTRFLGGSWTGLRRHWFGCFWKLQALLSLWPLDPVEKRRKMMSRVWALKKLKANVQPGLAQATHPHLRHHRQVLQRPWLNERHNLQEVCTTASTVCLYYNATKCCSA